MPKHNFEPLAGRLETIRIDSEALAGNTLGDPHERSVAVYLPYDPPEHGVPLLVDLTGYTGSGLKHVAWTPFGESVPQRLERLRREGALGPVAVAFPDCFTSLGGNQYVDNPVLGGWETFLLEDMLPALEREFPLRGGAANRAVFGKSSGGYGAYVQAFRHGDRWAGAASLSGDVGFELLFASDFPKTLTALREFGGPAGFIEAFHEGSKVRGDRFHTLMMLAMAATYDPAPDEPYGVRLPVDSRTCERIPERWANWLACDPLTWVEDVGMRASASKLKAFWIDCGSKDQYHLAYGSRRLHDALERHGVEHRYEEFDDDHSGIDYRMDVALPWLWERLWAST